MRSVISGLFKTVNGVSYVAKVIVVSKLSERKLRVKYISVQNKSFIALGS